MQIDTQLLPCTPEPPTYCRNSLGYNSRDQMHSQGDPGPHQPSNSEVPALSRELHSELKN